MGLSAVCIISSLLNSSLVLAFAHRASFSRRFKLERNEEEALAASSAAIYAPADDMKSADAGFPSRTLILGVEKLLAVS